MEETSTKIRENIPVTSTVINSIVCSCCNGTGWELFTVNSDALVSLYGERENLISFDFVRKCKKCNSFYNKSNAEMPSNYVDADIGKFDFSVYSKDQSGLKKIAMSIINDFKLWNSNGRGLYFWSNTPGSGKTFLACCIARSIEAKYGIITKFINVIDYISKVGESYKREAGQNDVSEIYRTCDLLILDDIGSQKQGEWQEQELFRLIDNRMQNNLITIYTSNMSFDDLKVSDRVKSRLAKGTIEIKFPEESIRDIKSKKEASAFLEKVLQNNS